jgi:thioredoxin reductase (NADPH)
MNDSMLTIFVYGIPLILLLGSYVWFGKRSHTRSLRILQENQEAGLNEPASLHPLIDTSRCIGCSACVSACPRKKCSGPH